MIRCPVALRRAVEEPPARLPLASFRRQDKRLVLDLDHVLARALAKNPGDRYPTVNSFCEDLRNALKGRPVVARSGERGYVFGRYVRRHRLAGCGSGRSRPVRWQAGSAPRSGRHARHA